MGSFDDAKILFVVLHIANQSWPLVLDTINWFQENDKKKKLWVDEVEFQLANGLVKISSLTQLGYRMVGHPLHLKASKLIARLQSLMYRMNM
jgi:hypothetical protein